MDFSLANAQQEAVIRIVVWCAKGPDILRSELLHVLLQPRMHLVEIAGRSIMLRKDVWMVSRNALPTQLYHCVHHMYARTGIHAQILLKEE